ncbi:hypothetical protein BO94DRAFT_602190 [Aspergillus sclerotioniger CBS 115572]|uniref:Zn(2)-C6 fungal-type domain-containing protein n=1 Tax=Aspergillus sclerotioniger CBS 115572 TaxID=1450535 RepID=A0A317W6A0_9EURO|nr:hypothetical protein BO94DRAFT_602190 [Aspergillus sclerotioniger CBS 115572]PWY80832.1 hypothetical protein BO94DRAFT_602190 [Aspergillus sclerotioniger CBS 115572]
MSVPGKVEYRVRCSKLGTFFGADQCCSSKKFPYSLLLLCWKDTISISSQLRSSRGLQCSAKNTAPAWESRLSPGFPAGQVTAARGPPLRDKQFHLVDSSPAGPNVITAPILVAGRCIGMHTNAPLSDEGGGRTSESHPPYKRVRTQVSRACERCRIRRIKCDSERPCKPCLQRSDPCDPGGEDELKTFPQALREVDRLRQRVKELEAELSLHKDRLALNTPIVSTASSSPGPSAFEPRSTPATMLEGREGGHLGPVQEQPQQSIPNTQPHKSWGGINVVAANPANQAWYGPSSLFYFIDRMARFLSINLHQNHSAEQMSLYGSTRALLGDPPGNSKLQPGDNTQASTTIASPQKFLSLTQEEYFLDLYWSSYHTALAPILNEAEFRQHYRSLWIASGNTRQPSALADIVVAVSMQLGMSMLPPAKQKEMGPVDASMAGQWYFQRCRTLLAYELESPTLATVQALLLSAIYLCSAAFHNMSDNVAGQAARAACALGLHHDPPDTLPQPERELRRRLWWALVILDTKIGLKLGRPLQFYHTESSPALPDDQLLSAMGAGSDYSPLGDTVTWLSFNLHNTKLFLVARSAQTTFYGKGLALHDGQSAWDNQLVLESLAESLHPFVQSLQQWVSEIPDALKLNRENDGSAFSTDGSKLEIELFAPAWVQRQRFHLELTYHYICFCLFRPLISYSSVSAPTAVYLAEKSALHGIALTNITHQALTTTSVLAGWHEAFQWQWSAAITLVGFVLAYPHAACITAAKQAIDTSIAVFEIFGESFVIGTKAANTMRSLVAAIDLLRRRQATAGVHMPNDIQPLVPDELGSGIDGFMSSETFDFDAISSEQMQDIFQVALSIDQWSYFDALWASGNGLPAS